MYNKVILLGRLGRDPEVRNVSEDRKVALLRVATNRYYKKEGENQPITDWHSIVCWGRLAEICESYLTTGRMVHVEGYLQTRSYDDRDGIRRYATEVVATNLVMVNGGNEEGQRSPSQNKESIDNFDSDFDDLPDDL